MNMVMAMNMGADDFVPKPFDMNVLVAKIQALLRRTYAFQKNETALTFNHYTLDMENGEISNETDTVSLSKTELKMLHLLFQNPNKIVTKQAIMEKLWEGDQFIDSNTLSVNMTRLRKKLLDIGFAGYIHTAVGKGYYLNEAEK
jgi:DNA-binding response OmpR family regulator